MITKENQFRTIFRRIGAIFNELMYIQIEIKNKYIDNSQTTNIQHNYINNYIELLNQYVIFYNNELSDSWSLNKKIEFVYEDIRSFFRQFENPNLNSSQWYERTKYLLELLAAEQQEIKDLAK